MDGHPEVIDRLNQLLTAELTAIDVYFLQARMFQDWGYNKLFERFDHEKDDEQGHCALIIERILLLGGTPNVHARQGFTVERDAKAMLELDLKLELEVKDNLNAAIALCRDHGDNGTREMLERLLLDTENDHIFWMESQLKLIADMGIENYLSQQI
ncbi:MAG: bacterioferritin [Planctomycetota bacterium]|nr:bacterioferritin [Planctomycetota bacterium]